MREARECGGGRGDEVEIERSGRRDGSGEKKGRKWM